MLIISTFNNLNSSDMRINDHKICIYTICFENSVNPKSPRENIFKNSWLISIHFFHVQFEYFRFIFMKRTKNIQYSFYYFHKTTRNEHIKPIP